MNVILMAAGKGSRISRYIGDNPKCTLDIGGNTLIRNTVEMLLCKHIAVTIVVGYQKEAIFEALKGLDVQFIVNPFYDVTNSIVSLWFVKSFLEQLYRKHANNPIDLILGNADVYWDETILHKLEADEHIPLMLADSSRVKTGDYLFEWQDHRLLDHGKNLSREIATGEYVGLAKLKSSFLPPFINHMDKMISEGRHGVWWENILYELNDTYPIYVKDIAGDFWAEVDYIEDYERILAHRGVTNIK